MKRMCNMQMHGCCCQMMMTMTGKERSIYIIGTEQTTKKKRYEKDSISHSIYTESQRQQRLWNR